MEPTIGPPPSFAARRLSASHPRGVHLTVAALACFLGVCVVLACLPRVVTGGLDGSVATRLHDHARSHPNLVAAGRAITSLGSAGMIGTLAVAIGVLMACRHRFDLLACWVIGLAGGSVLRWVLKRVVGRPRPAFSDPFVLEGGFSFPSGHTLGSVVCFGLLAYFALLVGRSRRAGFVAVGIAVVITAAVAASRLYIGAHYPTDVLAGYAAGVAWLGVWVGS